MPSKKDLNEQVQADVEDVEVREEDRPLVSNNDELAAADDFVGSEHTQPAHRRNHAHLVGRNESLGGLPSDLHLALTSVVKVHAGDAELYEEIVQLLERYEGDEEHPEVKQLLHDAKAILEPKARLHKAAKHQVEKHS